MIMKMKISAHVDNQELYFAPLDVNGGGHRDCDQMRCWELYPDAQHHLNAFIACCNPCSTRHLLTYYFNVLICLSVRPSS